MNKNKLYKQSNKYNKKLYEPLAIIAQSPLVLFKIFHLIFTKLCYIYIHYIHVNLNQIFNHSQKFLPNSKKLSSISKSKSNKLIQITKKIKNQIIQIQYNIKYFNNIILNISEKIQIFLLKILNTISQQLKIKLNKIKQQNKIIFPFILSRIYLLKITNIFQKNKTFYSIFIINIIKIIEKLINNVNTLFFTFKNKVFTSKIYLFLCIKLINFTILLINLKFFKYCVTIIIYTSIIYSIYLLINYINLLNL